MQQHALGRGPGSARRLYPRHEFSLVFRSLLWEVKRDFVTGAAWGWSVPEGGGAGQDGAIQTKSLFWRGTLQERALLLSYIKHRQCFMSAWRLRAVWCQFIHPLQLNLAVLPHPSPWSYRREEGEQEGSTPKRAARLRAECGDGTAGEGGSWAAGALGEPSGEGRWGAPQGQEATPGHPQLPSSFALPFSLPCLKEGPRCRPAGSLPQRRLTADLSGRVLWDHGVGGELGVQDAAVRVGVHGQRVQQLPVLQHPRVQRGPGLGDQLGDVV